MRYPPRATDPKATKTAGKGIWPRGRMGRPLTSSSVTVAVAVTAAIAAARGVASGSYLIAQATSAAETAIIGIRIHQDVPKVEMAGLRKYSIIAACNWESSFSVPSGGTFPGVGPEWWVRAFSTSSVNRTLIWLGSVWRKEW